eukprot:scaffold470_cov225-Prasinococcus_capsulatus_cf.AAC.1
MLARRHERLRARSTIARPLPRACDVLSAERRTAGSSARSVRRAAGAVPLPAHQPQVQGLQAARGAGHRAAGRAAGARALAPAANRCTNWLANAPSPQNAR